MVRKSIFANLEKGSVKQRVENDNDVFELSWLSIRGDSSRHGEQDEVDLSCLYHFMADKTQPKLPERVSATHSVARQIRKQIRDKRSENTFYEGFYVFRRYIQHCDANGIDPFSSEGYLAYAGDKGHLRQKVALYESCPVFLAELDDGAELGHSEVTAGHKAMRVRTFLRMGIKFDESLPDKHEPFSQNERKLTIPYSTEDTDRILKVLLRAFDGLYELISSVGDISLIPTSTVINLGDGMGEVTLNSEANALKQHPLNVCMSIGYALFSYYTALNRTVILNAAHPIEFEKRIIGDKTLRSVTLSLWKSRAGRFVEGVLTNEVPVQDISENEFDVAIEKKTGVELVKKLIRLAEICGCANQRDPLFFHLGEGGNVRGFDTSYVSDLPLLFDMRLIDTTPVNKVFLEGFRAAITGQNLHVSAQSDGDSRRLSKKLTRVGTYKAHKEAVSCAMAILSSYNNPEAFFGATLPLRPETENSEGMIEWGFTKSGSGERGCFYLPKELSGFVTELMSWAECVQDEGEVLLLPIPQRQGGYRKDFEWLSPERLPSLHTTIRLLNIPSGKFYIDLNTKRFRALTATIEYDDSDFGYSASVVLDNDISTYEKHYLGGDQEENQLIMAQSLEVASQLFKGKSKAEAIQATKESLKRDVLAFDEYKRSRLHINQNGFACSGAPDIDRSIEPEFHRSAKRQADKLGVPDAPNMPCYQYDQCCHCKSAKMVDDVNQVYKLLSFISVLEDRADLRPDDGDSLTQKAAYLRLLIDENISSDVALEAERKLMFEGEHPLVRSMQVAQLFVG